MNRAFYKRKFLGEQEKKVAQPVEPQRSTSHVPILQQLEAMLIGKLQKPEPLPLPVHTVQTGDTLSGMARQYLQKGERWPEIRDINIPVLEEGLKRFQPGDPRLERELGHWIFPGQEFQIPTEPPPEMPPEALDVPPVGLREELQRILRGEPARRFSEEDLVKPVRDAKEMIPAVEAEQLTTESIHPKQRMTIDPEKLQQLTEKTIEASKRRMEPRYDMEKIKTDAERYLKTKEVTPELQEFVKAYVGRDAIAEDMTPQQREAWDKYFVRPQAHFFKGAYEAVGLDLDMEKQYLTEGDARLVDHVMEFAGGITPYVVVGALTGGAGPAVSNALSRMLPTKAATILGASAGSAVMGGTVSALRELMGSKDPDFDPVEAIKRVGMDTAVFGMFGAARAGIGTPLSKMVTSRLGNITRDRVINAIEESARKGAVAVNLNNLLTAVTGSLAGSVPSAATVGILEATFNYLKNPEEYTAKMAAGDIGTRVLMLAGIDMVFTLLGFRPITAKQVEGWREGMKRGAEQRAGFKQSFDDYYKILDLKPGASVEDIKRSYRSLARKYHPDFNKDPSAAEMFVSINEAYKALTLAHNIGALKPEFDIEPDVKPTTTQPLSLPGGASPPQVSGPPQGVGPKLPQSAYDLVVRTKSPLKKQYGRDIIAWLEGGEKPAVPEGLSEADAKDMEIKLSKMAEREGIVAPETEEPPEVPGEVKAPVEEAPTKEPWGMTKTELSKEYGSEMGIPDSGKPWSGTVPPVGTWRMDPNTGAMEQLRLMKISDLHIAEPENEVLDREDYKRYVEWAEQGKQPPPINVIKNIDGTWVSNNRRRTMAAREAGQDTILAWVSDTDPKTGAPIPTHEGLTRSALEQGKPVPRDVLEEYKGRDWADEALAKLEEKPPAKEEPKAKPPVESKYEALLKQTGKTVGKLGGIDVKTMIEQTNRVQDFARWLLKQDGLSPLAEAEIRKYMAYTLDEVNEFVEKAKATAGETGNRVVGGKYYDLNEQDTFRAFYNLGKVVLPGIRGQDAEDVGITYLAFIEGDIDKGEYAEHVKHMYESGRVKKPEFEKKPPAKETKGEKKPDEPEEKTGIERAAEARRKKILSKRMIYGEYGVMTRKEFVEARVADGWEPVAKEVPDYAREKRIREEIDYMRKNAPLGNAFHPQTIKFNDLNKQLKEGITKTEYSFPDPKDKNSYYKLTKIEYDYARELIEKRKSAPVKEAEKPTGKVVAPTTLKELQGQMQAASPGHIGKDKSEALGALVRGVAAYKGMSPDEYVRQRFQGVVMGGEPGAEALLKQMEEDDRLMSHEPAGPDFKPPKKTIKAYKLFNTYENRPGRLFPLYIGKAKETPIGTWMPAEFIPTPGFADRPGWHCGPLPYTPHLQMKVKHGDKEIQRVWAEVELPADVDWQAIASKSKTGDIRDRTPDGGYYIWKRPESQGGNWYIGGAIKVNRILTASEVKKILEDEGLEKNVEGVTKASVEFDEDGRALIRALEATNVADMAHELGHVFRRDLSLEDLQIAEEWAGVKDGDWTREAEEKFALGFENYLAEGKAPSEGLRKVFEQFKKWLTEIYKKIKGSVIDVKLSGRMRGVFDRMVSGQKVEKPLPKKPAPEAKPPAKKEAAKVEPPKGEKPPELKPFKPVAEGKTVTAYTDNNDPIEVKYAISEAEDLVTSHDTKLHVDPVYPKELQPRQRERVASEVQVSRIAGKLNPARLGENAMISDGAPVVGPDGVVEAGNGRTIALKRVYEQDTPKAKEYKDWLINNSGKFGFDPGVIEKAKNPVLVRVRQTNVDRVAFTQEGNVSTVAEMSAAEIAIQDAKKLNTKVLSGFVPNEGGRIDTAANRGFIRSFIADVVPASEQGKMLDAKGILTQDGVRRIRNAIFARVYGNATALEKLSEDADANVRNQISAMVNAAPLFLEIKDGMASGEYFPLDITDDIAAAMVKLSSLRDSGMTVQGYLQQMSLFGEELTDIGKAVLNIFDKHKRSAKRITAILQEYAHGVVLAGSPKQQQIFATNPPAKDDLLSWAVKKVEDVDEGQLTIFEAQAVGAERTGPPGKAGEGGKRKEGTGRDKLSEQEEKLDKKAGEHKHELSAGQSVRIVRGRPSDGEHTFETAEVEARYQAAHGVETPGFWRKTRDMLTELGHMFSRSHKHLPNTGYYMPCRNLLINLAKGKSIAADKTVRRMKGMLADLLEDRPAYNLFERKVIMDDLKEGYDRYLDSLKESGMSEAQVPFRWQFGLTKETFAKEYKLLNDAISKNPVVEKVLKERADFWDALVGAYTEAQKAIGHKVDSKFTRTSYYRHQVLEYAHARSVIVGTGERLKTPRGRSWLKHRIEEGSELDFNTNYLEAEFEVIAQMYYDMQVAEAIGKIDKRYNIVDQLKAQAVEVNDERIMPFMQQIADALNKMKGPKVTKDYTAEDVYRNILNKKTAIGFDRLGELAASGALPDRNGDFAKLIAELSNVYLTNKATKKKLGKDWTIQDQVYLPNEYANQIFSYCNWILKAKGSISAKGAAATIFKGIHEKKDTIKKTLGRNYVTWEDLIPEGFTIWQPTKGNVFFFADTIPAGIAERLIEGKLEQVGVTKDMLRRVLAKGGRNKEMVVDANIAATLDDLTGGSKSSSLVWNISKSAMDLWKEWQLISPPRYVKFNLRNFTGDVEYPFALNPRLLKYAPQAMKDLFDFMVRGAKPTKLIAAWAERGGLQSTLQYQEMGAINHLKDFENLVKKHKSIKDIPANVFRKYWETARLTTDYREGILRYAAFTEAVESMKGNIKPAYLDREGNIADGHLQEAAPRNFGVSDKEEIMSLDNIYDRAYWISNELIGAYDRVSTAGKFLRTYLMPFWSWKEVNLTRFIKTMKLIANDDTIAERVGRYFVNKVRGKMGMSPLSRNTRRSKSAWRKVATSPLILARIGTVMIKLMAFWIATGLFNRYFFPDSQYTLPRETRKSYHLVVGRDEKGSIIYYDRLGSMSDLFEWIGDTPWNYVIDVMTGRKTAMDVAKEMAVAPVKLMYGELGPHFQLATELITGKSTFPDPTDPGDIQNRWRHIMQGLGLAAVYDRIAGKPTRTYGDDAKRLIAYVQEPGQGAYYDIRDEVREFLSSEGAAQGRWSGEYNAKSDALYNLRLAIRYEDQEAMEKYAVLYVNSGGTKDGLETSLKKLHPLGQLSDARKSKFVNEWLDEEGKERLRWAEKFYYETLLGNPRGQFGYPTETMERISKAVYADRK